MSHLTSHLLASSGLPGARIRATDLELPQPISAPIDAHRRLRGPYTAAGTLMRDLVPDALARNPELVRAHELEILSVAPELGKLVEATRETLTSLAVPAERTRFYSRLRTLRLAHGLTEFLRDYARTLGGPLSLVIDRIDQADQTDRELVSVLLRRIDPAELTIVVGTGETAAADTPLGKALARYAREVPCRAADMDTDVDNDDLDLARRYVADECTNPHSSPRSAYERLPQLVRATLHDERAAELEARGEPSLALGAIPFHLAHGSDPVRAVKALRHAIDTCIDMGYYEATIELGVRGREFVDGTADLDSWWIFTTKMTTSLAALGRADEAEGLYDEARALTDDPGVHRQAAYATAMLYTRHHRDEQKNHRKAMGLINESIAFSRQLSDPQERAFNTVFNRNGKALIVGHLGRPEEALRLVTEGLDLLDAELDRGEHQLHRSVLRYNRAQVYAGLGRLEEAVADYLAVIEQDPNYPEYHFDLGNLLRRQGRPDEAVAQYETAMRLSPPFPELYYNRADARMALGDLEGAIADFRYVLEIDPEYVDASVNLAGLLADLDRVDEAEDVARAGLELSPDHPHLNCAAARLALDANEPEAARAAIARAMAGDPIPTEAWALRGTLAFHDGDLPGAAEAFARAAELLPDAAVFYNLGAALEQSGERDRALAAYSSAFQLDPEDDDARSAIARCSSAL